jgi:hypothetical protein
MNAANVNAGGYAIVKASPELVSAAKRLYPYSYPPPHSSWIDQNRTIAAIGAVAVLGGLIWYFRKDMARS